MFLDLALDDFQRICIENLFSSNIDNDILVDLICVVLDQLIHTAANKELQSCCSYFNRLTQQKRFSQEWALQAKAACDRIERFLCTQTDSFYALFQPKAELLGAAFQADEWTISLFSEEISRGQLSFVLAQLIRHINPQLRSIANIGAWEIVSRYTASGRVCCVDSLSSVQFKSFDEQTIIVTDAVSGNEEIPDGVTAVITPDATDIVSHVAIRARNAQLLFATCYDSAQISHLRSLQGRMLQLDVTPGGDITVDENGITVQNNTISDSFSPDCMNRPELCDPIIDNDAFEPARVGAKSLNLRRLKTCLPDWIHVPYSSALPYFLTEHVFDAPENKAHLKTYSELLAGIDNPTDTVPATLKKLQQTIMRLDCPRTIESDIKSFISKHHGPDAADWPAIWQSIKLVWASKWNERAFISRCSRGIPHELLHIAVLIQQVVSAQYSFVIHTVNPFDRNRDEVYAEIVPGLGETLVGNYPGRAMSFACSKSLPNPKILMYPSKSFGLHG
ncbi:MAG: hypothetical protein GY868_12730, partial [Deltaproteobacteria bacterium]|nr:hypothetical protein [Deltaproteobacteria bacterium]